MVDIHSCWYPFLSADFLPGNNVLVQVEPFPRSLAVRGPGGGSSASRINSAVRGERLTGAGQGAPCPLK